MKPKYKLRCFLALTGSSLLAACFASAADGTWNVNADGNWSTTTNWLSGTVADGSGSTANFTNLITANRIVTLDSDRTLTNLVFGDPFTPYTNNLGNWTLSGSGKLTLAGTTPGITVHNLGTGNVATISSVIEGTNGLVKNGRGFLTLNSSAVNTFTGGLTVNAGTMRLAYGSLATPTDLVNSGNSVTLGGGVLQIHAKGTATTNQTFNGLTVAAGGGSILSTNNSAANVTNINLGALTTSASGGSLLVGSNSSTAGLTITTSTNKDTQGIYGGRVVFWNGTANTGYDWATTTSSGPTYTLSGLVSGSDYTTLPTTGGSGTVNYKMTVGTTLAGSFSVNSLKLEAPGGALALGANLLTINSGGLLMTGTTGRSITMTGSGTRLTAGADSNYELIVHQYNNSTGGLDIQAVIGNNGANAVSLVKAGTGVLRLSGSNTYTGVTYVNAGQLRISNVTNVLGTTAGNTVVASGAHVFAGAPLTDLAEPFAISGTGDGNGALRFGGGGVTNLSGAVTLDANASIQNDGGVTMTLTGGIDTAGNTVTLNAGGANFIIDTVGISGAGSVFKDKAGTATFNATNSHSVATTINAGTLTVGATGTLSGSAATLEVNNTNSTAAGTDVVLNLSTGADTTVGSLSGTIATPTSGTNTATINTQTGRTFTVNQTSNSAYAGVIAGDGAFTLGSLSTNTLTLNGTNTYTGATNVNGGKLVINGSTSSTSLVTVASGATLGGTGTVGAATTINGILAPGNSIGKLTANADVTWNDNDAWVFELGSAASTLALANTTPGLSDLLDITGAGSDFLKGTGSSFTFDFAGGGMAGWYKLVDWTGTTNFTYTDFFTQNLGTGLTGTFTVDSGTSALYLNVVPEPRAALLGGLGLLMLLRRRR